MTRAETLFWHYLKAHHLDGMQFRRQTPIGTYIADFSCHSARLIVEVDGETHDFHERQERDAARARWFVTQGYRVLRFTDDDVLSSLERVIAIIRNAIPLSLSLPTRGEGTTHQSPEFDPCP
jgi:very-short-patch-repair endonuclease